MKIQVRQAEYQNVEGLRELYRQEANCQIRYDSMLARGLADPYILLVKGRTAGYGAILNKYDAGRLTEFYVLPSVRSHALPLFQELLSVSRATQIAAQTNIPLLLGLLYDCAGNIATESILFGDASVSSLTCPGAVFRHAEPVGNCLVEEGGTVVATGGFLCHYNPPYGDVFMEVMEPARQRGIGSYLVQEVKRVCYETGKKPAARCDPSNIASRRTLEKAGFLPCARLLVGTVMATTEPARRHRQDAAGEAANSGQSENKE